MKRGLQFFPSAPDLETPSEGWLWTRPAAALHLLSDTEEELVEVTSLHDTHGDGGLPEGMCQPEQRPLGTVGTTSGNVRSSDSLRNHGPQAPFSLLIHLP